MGNLRMVFCDMDGTLLADDKSIPSRNIRLLNTLAELGIEFVPCTGRPAHAVPREVLAHPATRYVIAANGTIVRDVKRGSNIKCTPLQKERVVALYDKVRDWPITFDVFADGQVYSERARYDSMGSLGISPGTLAMLRKVRVPVDLKVPQIVERATNVEKITCFFGDVSLRDKIVELAQSIGRLSYACGDPSDVELMAPGVSKGAALEWLCDHLGVPIASVAAFGDEENDESMVRVAGYGVAMANASPGVRRAAAYHTASNNEAGVATFVESLLRV